MAATATITTTTTIAANNNNNNNCYANSDSDFISDSDRRTKGAHHATLPPLQPRIHIQGMTRSAPSRSLANSVDFEPELGLNSDNIRHDSKARATTTATTTTTSTSGAQKRDSRLDSALVCSLFCSVLFLSLLSTLFAD